MSKSLEIKDYTSKQMGDACEILVAGEFTLAGIPALKVPDNWPHYDIIAQPKTGPTQRISVKSRTYKKGPAFMAYDCNDQFDWLALVILPGGEQTERRFFIIPRALADIEARRHKPTTKTANNRYWKIQEVEDRFLEYENNFKLRHFKDV